MHTGVANFKEVFMEYSISPVVFLTVPSDWPPTLSRTSECYNWLHHVSQQPLMTSEAEPLHTHSPAFQLANFLHIWESAGGSDNKDRKEFEKCSALIVMSLLCYSSTFGCVHECVLREIWAPCGVEGVRGSLTGPLTCTPQDLLWEAHTEPALMSARAPRRVLQVFSVTIKETLNTGVLVHTNRFTYFAAHYVWKKYETFLWMLQILREKHESIHVCTQTLMTAEQ